MAPEQLRSQLADQPSEHLKAFEAALQEDLLKDPEKNVGFISDPSMHSNHFSVSSGLARRRCRLCQNNFQPAGCCRRARPLWEDDNHAAELISPCHCLQSSEDELQTPERTVVHRGCLDALRASISDARAFTHCADCGYAYCLKLAAEVPGEMQQRARRRRRHLGRVTGNFALWALATQMSILGTAMLIRALDPSEAIPLWLGAGSSGSADYWDGLKHHAGAYYFASALCCCTLAGLGVLLYNITQCCRTCASTEPLRGDVCCYTCDCHEMGLHCCQSCGRGFLLASCEGWTPECGACCAGGCDEFVIVLLILAVVILILCLLAGIIWLLVACVVAVQHAWKEFLRLRELRRLATDYVVQDLSPFPTSGAPSFTSSIPRSAVSLLSGGSALSKSSCSKSPKSQKHHSLMNSEEIDLDAPSQQDMENMSRTMAIRAEFLQHLEAHDGARTVLLAPVTNQTVQSMLLDDLGAICGARRRGGVTF